MRSKPAQQKRPFKQIVDVLRSVVYVHKHSLQVVYYRKNTFVGRDTYTCLIDIAAADDDINEDDMTATAAATAAAATAPKYYMILRCKRLKRMRDNTVVRQTHDRFYDYTEEGVDAIIKQLELETNTTLRQFEP